MSFQIRALTRHPAPDVLNTGAQFTGFFTGLTQPLSPSLVEAGPAPAFLAPQHAPQRASQPAEAGFYATRAKRGIDMVLSALLIVLSAPALVLLALALWAESGNPFYSQPRLGRNGRVFRMFKLRSMVKGAEGKLAACLAADPALKAEWDRNQKLKNDPRVTPLGRLVRKTSMDELPQLFNVLRGDMSLIGPRPMLSDQMPLYLHPEAYLALRPGLSGLWQVSARNDEDFDTRAMLDRKYLQRISFWLDLRILLATFRAVVRATGY